MTNDIEKLREEARQIRDELLETIDKVFKDNQKEYDEFLKKALSIV